MATAAELLASVGTDDDAILVIDNHLRTITIPNTITNLGVESDDEVLRLDFKMPRYLDDIDLSKFSIRINYMNANGEGDVYTVNDAIVGNEYITFSWLVGPTATAYKGSTKFNVCLKIVDNQGFILKEYNTTPASLPVLEGLEVDEQVIRQYSDILEQWKNELFGIGDTEEASMRAVSQEEQDNIAQKGAEVLATIPKEYQETAEAAQEGIRTKADAIVSTAQGSVVTVSDSSDDHLRGLRVFGKTVQVKTTGAQVIPRPYYDSSMVRHGVTFTVNNDGSITMVGTNTATDNVSCYFMLYLGSIPTGVYTYKCYGLPQTCVTNIYFRGDVVGEESAPLDLYDGNEYGFVIRIKAGASVNDTVYPMLNAGDTALPYEPYSGGIPSPNPDYPQDFVSPENVTTTIYGKNFWPVDHIELTGTSRGDVMFEGRIPLPATLSWTQDFSRTTGSALFSYEVDGKTYFTASAEVPGRFVHIINKAGVLEKITLLNWAPETGNLTDIQLELGSEATDYEPYHDVQSINVQRTLPGIPVNSGGNYTDSDGQQWVCDEIDFERGVYVQRINKVSLTGNETYGLLADSGGEMFVTLPLDAIYTNSAVTCKCNYYPAVARQDTYDNGTVAGFIGLAVSHAHARITDNSRFNGDSDALQAWVVEKASEGKPLTIEYILGTPIETALTAEEIAAYKALCTNYPNTTVLNDAGAWMELSYNADTETYVYNKQPLYVYFSSNNNTGVYTATVSFDDIKSAYQNYRDVIGVKGAIVMPLQYLSENKIRFQSTNEYRYDYVEMLKTTNGDGTSTVTIDYRYNYYAPKAPDSDSYALSSELKGYAKNSSLAGFAKTSDLDDYLKASDLVDYAKTTDVRNPLYVFFTLVNGVYTATVSFDDIKSAYQNYRDVIGVKGTLIMPLQYLSENKIRFQSTNEYRYDYVEMIKTTNSDGEIITVIDYRYNYYAPKAPDSDSYALASELSRYATQTDLEKYVLGNEVTEKATDEKFFDIDYDGLVSLRPEYRGDPFVYKNSGGTIVYPFSLSDVTQANNYTTSYEGSKISELPERIIIPNNVDGQQVTGFQAGAFCGNKRIKEVVLPKSVTELPGGTFREAIYLEKVGNTEQITKVGNSAFAFTRVGEIHLPNLTSDTAHPCNSVFQNCSCLVVADIGNITSIGKNMFEYCENLSEVLGGSGVTTIGARAFYSTRRLKSLPFLANLTSIGDKAFFSSRCDFEDVYDTLVTKKCSFGSLSTYKQYGSTDYWSGTTFTPCKTPLNSLFHQKNPLWKDTVITPDIKDDDGSDSTYGKTGCAFISLAEIYSAFEGVSFASPTEFADILETKELLGTHNFRDRDGWCAIAQGLGYDTVMLSNSTADPDVYDPLTKDELQQIYDALADGALVYRSTAATNENGGHATLWYGVNSAGEFLVSDTSMHCNEIGIYENHKSAWHTYKNGSHKCGAIIVKKPT